MRIIKKEDVSKHQCSISQNPQKQKNKF